jgi:hypothetical protein
MVALASYLRKGVTPERLSRQKQLTIDEFFISPPGQSGKCKYDQWKTYQRTVHGASEDAIPARKKSRIIQAVSGWRWPTNRDRWRTVEGDVVSLEGLKLAEFVCAVLAIRNANFSIVGASLRWTKQLTPPEFTYVYPEEELDVGVPLAKQKLADMEDEAQARSLLK